MEQPVTHTTKSTHKYLNNSRSLQSNQILLAKTRDTYHFQTSWIKGIDVSFLPSEQEDKIVSNLSLQKVIAVSLEMRQQFQSQSLLIDQETRGQCT